MKKWERIFEPKIALPLIILVALVYRMYPFFKYDYLFGYDPYLYLAYIDESMKTGYWIKFVTFAHGPLGKLMKSPLGLYLAPYYVYRLLNIFGVSLYDAFRVTPVIFGILTIGFFYLAMLKFYGKKEAFFSAFFLSVMFGHIFRSMANYYRGDNYMLFWYSVALFGISLAFKTSSVYRHIFYLMCGTLIGIAAFFWDSYYPIFVFVLGNGSFLGFGSFLLKKKERLLDSAVLICSTIFGAIIANYIEENLGESILWNAFKRISYIDGKPLNIGPVIIKDVYLYVHLKYFIPLTLSFVLFLYLLMEISENSLTKYPRIKLFFLCLFFLVIILWINKSNIFRIGLSTIKAFGIFESYQQQSIGETTQTTFKDIWYAYNLAIILVPFFLLRFRKLHLQDFVVIGFILPSLYLLYFWRRFLFISSLSIAIMSGLGLVILFRSLSLRFIKRKTMGVLIILILLIGVPVIDATLSFKQLLKQRPPMNKYWENALITLRDISHENDVVLAWWDYGQWISYYSRRAPVAQGFPSKLVTKYLLGEINYSQLTKKGVDYVIVSYDTALKFGAILDTANVPKERYFLAVLPLVSRVGALIFQQGQYTIIARPGKEWSILINTGTAVFSPKEAFLEYRDSITKLNITAKNVANAYVYLNLNYGYAVLMNEKTFNTTLAKLMFTNKYPEEYKLVYSDGGYIKIFRFIHPNIEIDKEGSTIRFEVTNGNKEYILCISGFYENGTKVFSHCYAVAKDKPIVIKMKIPEVKVIRYILYDKRRVLDVGVFRI